MSFRTVTELGEESIIVTPVIFQGEGLHTGEPSSVSVRNNPNEDGIFFERDGVRVKLSPYNVDNTGRTTSLTTGSGETIAMTVEHMLSAFYALRIRNVYVVLNGSPEIPILDGASETFIDGFERERRCIQKQINVVTLDEPFEVHDESDNKRSVRIDPGAGLDVQINSRIEYPNSPLGQQHYDFKYGDLEDYKKEIASARTSYPFYLHSAEDFERLNQRLKGIKHQGPDRNVNIVAPHYNFGDSMPNNVPRHKILDFLGDMHVLNLPLANGLTVTLNNSGHHLNNQLARFIFSSLKND